MIKLYEKIITNLFPTILLDGTGWRSEWNINRRERFVPSSRYLFFLIGFATIALHYLFDVPMGFEPIEHWFLLRVSVASGCILTLFFYMSPLATGRYYKVPAVLMLATYCYGQSIATSWYGREAWMFFFIFVLIAAIFLRLGSLSTLLFCVATILFAWSNLVEGGTMIPNLISGALMVTIGSSVLRSSEASEVRAFLFQKQNEKAQSTILSINSEFMERFQSFIPRVIGQRLMNLVENKRMSVVEATVEALKARRCEVACMFTDIRGFTQTTNELEAFIVDSVIPEVGANTSKIEDHDGIPRKIGDLIFAYFDEDSVHLNLTRCIAAGMEISRVNESMNATTSGADIHRYILISTGVAMVGNFGYLDSSIEITALGAPVNLLSRIDELTKTPELSAILSPGDLILDEESHGHLVNLQSTLQADLINLDKLDLRLRDFPNQRKLYRIRATDSNYEIVVQMNDAVQRSFETLPKDQI